MIATDCAAPRHRDEPEPALPHAAICSSCKTRLSRDLRRLPGLHAELATVIPGRTPGRGRGTGDGLPYDERASDCRSQIQHDLTYWAHQAAADRQTTITATTIAAMAGFLRGCLHWMIYRDWCPDLAAAVSDNRGQAIALLDPWVTRRFAIPSARCPHCGTGQLVVTVYASDGDKRRTHATCDTCDMTWLPEQWTRLGQQIIRRRELAA